jgi:coenzyme PQQ precursor peptide PqqA
LQAAFIAFALASAVVFVPHCGIRGLPNFFGDQRMKWETPVAIELRFGMEINSYVSVR